MSVSPITVVSDIDKRVLKVFLNLPHTCNWCID